MDMVNVSCLTQNQGKCILRYTCEELFGLYNWGGSYNYSTHSKFQCTKQLPKEVVVLQTNLPNHSNLGTKFCTFPGKGYQGITPSSGSLFDLLLVPLQAEDCITSWGDLAANSWKRR